MTSMKIVMPRWQWFMELCLGKMAMRSAQQRPDWRRQPASVLVFDLETDVVALKTALATGDIQGAIGMCAQVANRAMMVADTVSTARPGRRGPKKGGA